MCNKPNRHKNSLTLVPSRVYVSHKNKPQKSKRKTLKPRSYVVSRLNLWCERRDLSSAAATPCILMARRLSLSGQYPAHRSSLKTVRRTVFYAQTLSGSSPAQNKKEPLLRLFLIWCERRDLNPYGITTRPSNVRVCRFRHSRIFSSPFLTTNDIISKSRGSVNTFLENILIFSEKNYIVDFRYVDIKAFRRAFRYINRKCKVRFNRNVGNLCAFKYFVGILCGGVA